MSFERVATFAAVGISGLAFLYSYIEGERSNSRSNDISFSSYASKIARLESSNERLVEELADSKMQLDQLESLIASIPTDFGSAQLDDIQARLGELEARPLSVSGSVDVADVARDLFNTYGEQLRGEPGVQGPVGPRGEQGPKGDPGEAGGTSTSVALASPEVREQFIFDSEFDTKRIGDLQVDLVGCFNGGSSVSCEFQVESLNDDLAEVSFRPSYFRIALETSEWHRGERGQLLNKPMGGPSSLISHDFIPNLPVRVRIDFDDATTDGVGLPIVKFCTLNCNTEATWNNVAFDG